MNLPMPVLKSSDMSIGEEFFIPWISGSSKSSSFYWNDDATSQRLLQNFMVFKKQRDAEKWAHEILDFIEGKVMSIPHAEHL